MPHPRFLAIVVVVLAACSPAPVDKSPTPPGDAAVVRRPLAETPAAPATSAPPSTAAAAAGIVIPPDALYVCVSEKGGSRQTTSIEFAPKVGALCAKNPEMGPCQYERNNCRAGGGRVYAANGAEITTQTEAEYDKKVLRVRFKSN